MKVVTARQMQEIDRQTIETMGMPGLVLMALAGRSVADEILSTFPGARTIAVICGTGNNGGDGFVAAWFLANAGRRVICYLAGSQDSLTESAGIFCRYCLNLGIPLTELRETADRLELEGVDLMLDALYGTGFHGELRPPARDLIRSINDCDAPVVSIDIPSGLGADGGAPESEAVIADMTVAIGLPKLSLVSHPGIGYTGILRIVDIGFPAALMASPEFTVELIDRAYVNSVNASAIESAYAGRPDADKSTRGHVLVIGGFDGMEGAGLMAAAAAFQTGVGYVSLLTTVSARRIIAGRQPELMTAEIPDDILDPERSGAHALASWLSAYLMARRYDVVVVGPGLGRSSVCRSILSALLAAVSGAGIQRILVDGDGLFHLPDVLPGLATDFSLVLTPHLGEAARLLDADPAAIRDHRYDHAQALARRFGAVAVLKGPATIVADGVQARINTSGNPALATAGSGDVLSGIIAALLLRPHAPLDAAALGVHLHGSAADLLVASGRNLIKATDLLDMIPEARSRLFG